MKTVIVDDEQDAIFTLELIIQEYLPDVELIGKFTEPQKALKQIPILKPDLVFLDINMPEMNGFELLQSLEKRDFHIVFTTAYDEFALKAFKFNAVDYLLKPIDIDELKDTIKRLKARNKVIQLAQVDYTKILEEIRERKDEKISISTADGIYFLKPSEIVYLLASGSYTKVIRKTGDIIFVSKTLKDLESVLGSDFYRVHHSYIINLKYVKMLLRIDGWSLMMDNDDKIPIARRKRMDISNLISKIAGDTLI
jgi:two-component system, LytTR family, response regulator